MTKPKDQSVANSWNTFLKGFSPEKRFGLGLLVVAVFFSLHLACTGAATQTIFGHDSFVLYDGGWRVFNGVKPNVDFYSPLGPVTYLFVALGYRLFGANADSLAYMEAISLPLMMALVWFSLRKRMPWFWLFGSALLIGLCLVAQHPPRQVFWYDGYSQIYDRFGYAGVMLFALLLFCPSGEASQNQLRVDSFLAGGILSTLFFIKVSFLIASIPLLMAFLLLREKAALSPTMFCLGFLIVTLSFLAYLNFDVGSILADLSVAAGSRIQMFSIRQMVNDLEEMSWQLVIVGALVFASSRFYLRPRWDILILFAGFLLCSVAVYETNCPLGVRAELPLLPTLLILLALSGARPSPKLSDPPTFRSIARNRHTWLVAVLLALNFYILNDGASILSSAYRHIPADEVTLFAADPIKHLVFHPYVDGLSISYPDKINDGLRLLRENNLTHTRCAALDFSSPFSFALGAPPPVGFPVFWQVDISFSKSSYPDQQKVFRGIDVILVPKYPEVPEKTTILLKEIYRDYLQENFTPIADSKYWTILKRK